MLDNTESDPGFCRVCDGIDFEVIYRGPETSLWRCLGCGEEKPREEPTRDGLLPTVITDYYEQRAGVKPQGPGAWAFCAHEEYRGPFTDPVYLVRGRYTEAVKAARAEFRGRCRQIVVMP